MALFDGYLDCLFKRDADDNLVFFPHGSWGRGYIVPSNEVGRQVRVYLQLYYLLLIPLAVVSIAALGSSAPFLLPLWLLVNYAVHSNSVFGLQPSTERLGFRESFTVNARARSWITHASLLILSLAMVLWGMTHVVSDEPMIGMVLIGIGALGLTGASLAAAAKVSA